MLIAELNRSYPDFLNERPEISDLQTFYKQSKKRFDEDEEFKTLARETVVKLQSGDEQCMQAWKLLCELSRIEF